ncbi:MAG: hypothetical protein M3337_03960 [Actinomycetota bacterium]|nr:hypothetical protein [Actinomycetota bacterium]
MSEPSGLADIDHLYTINDNHVEMLLLHRETRQLLGAVDGLRLPPAVE